MKSIGSDYLAYPTAIAALSSRIGAVTPEEMAAWVRMGPKDGGLAAYLNANELEPPPRFYYDAAIDYGGDCNYLRPLMGCWFSAKDIAEFKPASRFITGSALRDRWLPILATADAVEAFIAAKERETRLLSMHPITGMTNLQGDADMPDWSSGVFAMEWILEIEKNDFPQVDRDSSSGSADATEPQLKVGKNPRKLCEAWCAYMAGEVEGATRQERAEKIKDEAKRRHYLMEKGGEFSIAMIVSAIPKGTTGTRHDNRKGGKRSAVF